MFDQLSTATRPSHHQTVSVSVLPCPEGRPMRLGAHELHPNARTLLRAGREVNIGSRAFDLLMILLHARGTLVTKEHILRHVWPTTIVEESNIRFQMVALRKALGDDHTLIKTVHGRGYVLIAETEPVQAVLPSGPGLASSGTGGADKLGGPVIFVVEHGRNIRDTLSQMLRSLDAEAFAQ